MMALAANQQSTPGTTEDTWSDLVAKSDALLALMKTYFERQHVKRGDALETIADAITTTRREIHCIRPLGFETASLLGTDAELDSITRDTEAATNAILESAEMVLGLDSADPALGEKVTDQVLKIFEACAFQDITGQRVKKIVTLLGRIEARISEMADVFAETQDVAAAEPLSVEEQRRRDLMLHGPAIGGPEVGQSEIDALFD